MIYFFIKKPVVFAVESHETLPQVDLDKLTWLFGMAELIESSSLEGNFTGPRREMISPWSTNAVEITQNMGIRGIKRIEEFTDHLEAEPEYDPMIAKMIVWGGPQQ